MAAIAAGDLRQLADRQIVAPGAFDDALAAALAGVALRDLGQRAVEVEAGGIVPQRDRQRSNAAVGVDEAVEQGALFTGLGGGLADDDKRAGQDLDVVGVAADLFRPPPDIGVIALGVGELAAAGKDQLRGLGGDLVPGIRSARLAHSDPQRRDAPGQPAACGARLERGASVEPQLGDVARVLL